MTSALLVTAPHHIMEVTRRRRRRRAYTRLSRKLSPFLVDTYRVEDLLTGATDAHASRLLSIEI
jgi:hypothetical protein